MITIEKAMEAYDFGFNVIYDGNNRIALYGTNCNHCGEYFTSENVAIYCKPCAQK